MNRIFKEFFLLKKMNWIMVLAMGLLIVIGVFFIYSSCFVSDDQPVRSLWKKQIVSAIAGAICFAVCAALDYHEWGKVAWWAYAGSIFLLIVVLLLGKKVYGAKRWLDLFGVGIQPSELAKVSTILVLARTLSRPAMDFESFKSIAMLLGIVALPFLLIVIEPDFGTALIFAADAVHHDARWRRAYPDINVIRAHRGAWNRYPDERPVSAGEAQCVGRDAGESNAHGRDEQNHKDRMKVFMNIDVNPLTAGWSSLQSKMAVGSGGAWGKGFLKGTQNSCVFCRLPFLPPTSYIP